MSKRSLIGLLPVAALLCGCGGPTVYPASGRVIYQDDSVVSGGGAVVFEPPAGSSYQVRGDIDSDGTFELVTTDESGDQQSGAPAGKYRVYLLPAEAESDPEGLEEPVEIAAEKYGDPERSGIKVEIKAEENKDITIRVEKPAND